ncbi:hypothetical protein JAAARDRAFT_69045, partial [Jaapia argillacea MUCL 33604]
MGKIMSPLVGLLKDLLIKVRSIIVVDLSTSMRNDEGVMLPVVRTIIRVTRLEMKRVQDWRGEPTSSYDEERQPESDHSHG